jgi:putative copper export protein/mono/diheme cytochrome c family protein
MRPLLLAALWLHLSASVLLVGAFFMLLLAGPSARPTARRWEATVMAWARLLVLLALASGLVGLLARTAVFEGRPEAALEPRAVWHAVLDTRPGLVWLGRHGLLVVLGAVLIMGTNLAEARNWIAARGEALLLAGLALALVSGSSHAAAVTPDTARALAVDVVHLLGTGVWMGGLVPLVLLLRAASHETGADARPYAVLAAYRFSRVALVTMILLTVSGALNAFVQVESMAGLAGTTHGRLLLAKLAVLVPIVALAAVNRARLLPALSGPDTSVGRPAMRRLATFVGVEVGLALVLLLLVAAMTLTTPARHAPPVWPFPFRFSLEPLLDAPALRWRALLGSQLAVLGVVALAASFLMRQWRRPVLAGLALVTLGAVVGLPPIVVDAYPTTYRRPLVTYHAASIAPGMSVYREHCATCHGATGAGDGPSMQERRRLLTDLRSPAASRRHAGELYWLVTHGIPERGMPGFEGRLAESERWDVINFIRALGAAAGSPSIGREVDPERPWLIAPDFTVSVGPLAPGALRDYRGRRFVLIVLYTLPGSGPRMADLARSYNLLWIMGVEVIAVPTDATPDAIRDLGSLTPPALFPVVTDGASAIVETYRLFAPGPHAELLIDRQGYLRAIWRGDREGMPPTAALTRQVELLNAEKNVPPFPDDHVH